MRNLKHLYLCRIALLFASALIAMQASAADGLDEARVESLLKQLTLAEKVSLLSGASSFATADIPRLGIHGMRFVDGPNGARSNDGDAATAFPVGISLAASWDPQMLRKVGAAIGEEVRALGNHVLLAPNLNLTRSPLSGRNFETYGEDPLLAGALGVGYVRGVQSVGVAATAKHYVGNEQETERSRSNSMIDARALHELYLKPFALAIRDAKPWAVMTAYNRLNGPYMSEHEPLVRHTLKDAWRFDGVVMSDWGGTHSIAAVNAGSDLEMPGPPRVFGSALLKAVQAGEISAATLDDAVRRMLRLYARVGALNDELKPAKIVSSQAHRELARAAAAQGIVLLKNATQALPLDISKLRKLAVIGPNADAVVIEGGGSAQVTPSHWLSPLDAIQAFVGNRVQVSYEPGADNERYTPALDGRDLSVDPVRKQRGLRARYYANAQFTGAPDKARVEQSIGALLLGNDVNLKGKGNLSAQWEGYFWPRRTGEYEFELEYLRVAPESGIAAPNATSLASLTLAGKALLDENTPSVAAPSSGFFRTHMRRAKVSLIAGQAYPIKLSYAGSGFRFHHLRVGVRQPESDMQTAVDAARNADAALVFVGSGSTAESEGRDRESMALYGAQDELVRAVAQANPRTIVVLNSGAPLAMPWVDQVAAIVQAWLPGQEGAYAVADVLFGKVNPSGKLPVTFPKRLQDSPSYMFYPGYLDAVYGESVFMGYRYYDKKEIEPLFPFGHGLSYTAFEYGNLRAPASVRKGQAVAVSVEVKNVGARAGAEVVQLYVSDLQCREACPVRELKAFQRIELQPGQSGVVTLQLDADAFAHYDAHESAWRTTPGKYRIAVGSSSRDLRLSGELSLAGD